jgi:hypothetical protein
MEDSFHGCGCGELRFGHIDIAESSKDNCCASVTNMVIIRNGWKK